MKSSILLSAAALLIGAVPTAHASDTMWFKDVAKPHGHVRSAAVRHADGRACGASASLIVPKNVKKFEACMAAHGWRLGGIYAERTHAVRPPASVEEDTSADDAAAAAQAAEEADDDARRNDESRAQTQQQIDDMNATQDMINNQQMLDAQQAEQNAINAAQ